MLAQFIGANVWAIYALLFIAPFVQEDAAVVAAATAFVTQQGHPGGLFLVTLLGLTVSDAWKYWAGALAYKWRWARRWVLDPRIAWARTEVRSRLGLTLLVARFVPGTRIPLYVACGLLHVPFWRFLALIIASGTLYLGVSFAAFALLGAVAGESVRVAAPFVVAALVLVVVGLKAFEFLRRRRIREELDLGPSPGSANRGRADDAV